LKEGKRKGYSATFVCLDIASASAQWQIKLVADSELTGTTESQIYAIHKAPLKDRPTQLGMMNVPIVLPPSLQSENIKAPPVTASMSSTKADDEDVEMKDAEDAPKASIDTASSTTPSTTNAIKTGPVSTSTGKRMKMVKVTRTFMENGYQMTETVNEMVPCDDDDPDAIPLDGASSAKAPSTTTASKASAPTAAKQSNLMSFFKKAKQ